MLFVLSESQEELGRCQKENDRLAVELEQAAMVAQVTVAILFNCIFYHFYVGSTFLTSASVYLFFSFPTHPSPLLFYPHNLLLSLHVGSFTCITLYVTRRHEVLIFSVFKCTHLVDYLFHSFIIFLAKEYFLKENFHDH